MIWNEPAAQECSQLFDIAADPNERPHVRMAALGTLVLPGCIEGHASNFKVRPFSMPASAGLPAIEIEPKNVMTYNSPTIGTYFSAKKWFGHPLLRTPARMFIFRLSDAGFYHELATEYRNCERSVYQETDVYLADILETFVASVRQ